MNPISHSYLVASYPNRRVSFVRGEGVYLFTREGEKYLDMGSNIGVSIFGYGHPRITEALTEQLRQLPSLHGSLGSEVRERAAERLVGACGGRLARVFFSNSGTEAIEAALKFARLATGKTHFIAMAHGYHGKTLGALSATDGEKYRDPFLPLVWDFSHVPFGDIGALRAQVREDTAAILIEPIQGEGGIRLGVPEYFAALQTLCNEKKVLLIVDEIQTALGRTGTFLAGEQYGLTPDILCLGKGLAGGVPVGATLVSETIAQKIPVHVHTSTFGGNPLACAGIVAVLGEFSDGKVFHHVREIGGYFLSQLRTLRHPQIVDIRGRGLMIGMELRENVTPTLQALQQRHIIAVPAGSNILRFLPPYLVGEKEIDEVMGALREIFR
jgi:acetylornithine/LysW-gamma-L-lysine aminotransferase